MGKSEIDINIAAERYGYARIGLSTPDGHWTFGNNGVVNEETPMPCSEDDSKDISYVKTILDFIKEDKRFDASRVWAEGFSQNSMFSAYIGFCFNDKVLGIWQGGSGMALTGKAPTLPGAQAQCTASAFAELKRDCMVKEPCEDCEYWPIYPCYNKKRAMIDCLADYKNDYIASGRDNPETESTAKYMKERLDKEGHDARLLRFSPSEDGSIAGGHKDPRNTPFWQVGCLGITEPCSKECETNFIDCVNKRDPISANDKAEAFQDCIVEDFKDLDGCENSCAPTFGMLSQSEVPEDVPSRFGSVEEEEYRPRNADSICEVDNEQ